ncbi:MAG TPA: hypothetical protein VIH67_14455 [Candidatus Acidoferrum sp.]
MQIDLIDVMRKRDDGSLIWVEAVQNVEAAKSRINNFGKTAPGEYVIFDQNTQQIVACVVAKALSCRTLRSNTKS